jgi:hypothetical protein
MRRALFLLAALLSGCADDFEKQSRISKLRILAVQAEPAELIADPNGPPPATSFTALAADPDGGVAQLTWALCSVQGTIPPPTLDCPGAQGFDLPSTASRGVLDLGEPRFRDAYQQLVGGPGGSPPAQVKEQLAAGIPVIFGFNAVLDPQQFHGLSTVTLRSPDPARPLNHNPAIASLTIDGVELAADGTTSVPAGKKVRLAPMPADGSQEATPDGPEKMNYTFFATGGEVQTLRSTDATATGEPADPSIDFDTPKLPGPVKLWVVVRDGRGGVGWMARTIDVR